MQRKTPRKKLSAREYRELSKYIIERDKWCVFCGNPNNLTNAHIIRRSAGGHDAANNIVAACIIGADGRKGCHQKFDDREIKLPASVAEMLKNEHGFEK